MPFKAGLFIHILSLCVSKYVSTAYEERATMLCANYKIKLRLQADTLYVSFHWLRLEMLNFVLATHTLHTVSVKRDSVHE